MVGETARNPAGFVLPGTEATGNNMDGVLEWLSIAFDLAGESSYMGANPF